MAVGSKSFPFHPLVKQLADTECCIWAKCMFKRFQSLLWCLFSLWVALKSQSKYHPFKNTLYFGNPSPDLALQKGCSEFQADNTCHNQNNQTSSLCTVHLQACYRALFLLLFEMQTGGNLVSLKDSKFPWLLRKTLVTARNHVTGCFLSSVGTDCLFLMANV